MAGVAKRRQCGVPQLWKMDWSRGVIELPSMAVVKEATENIHMGIISAWKMDCMDCYVVPEAPVLQMNGFHTKGCGLGFTLFVYIDDGHHVVQKKLHMMGSEEG